MDTTKETIPEYKWDFIKKLDYEYPTIKLDIGKGYVHPPNSIHDPWIEEKVRREGFVVPTRLVPTGEGK